MALPTELEERVARKAEEIVKRAATGSRGGVYAATHVGPRFASAAGSFRAASVAADRAFLRFRAATLSFEARRDLRSLAELRDSAQQVEALIGKAGMTKGEEDLLRAELSKHQLAAEGLEAGAKKVSEKIAAGSRAGGRTIESIRSAISARTQFIKLRQELELATRKLTADELAFLAAYRRFAETVGAELDEGWLRAIDYMATYKNQVKEYRKELSRLEAVLAKQTTPEKIDQLSRAVQAQRKAGVHSKVKSLLHEVYTVRSADWQLLRSSYKELAERAAAKLGKDWKVLSVSGDLYLGGAETWDEAMLLVLQGSDPPKAKLFLAAQFKAAIVPRALDQTLNDVVREAATTDLRIVHKDGAEDWFLLTPMPLGETSHRWVVDAAGGAIPIADIAAVTSRGVTVSQKTVEMTVDEFNVLADWLLKAADAVF